MNTVASMGHRTDISENKTTTMNTKGTTRRTETSLTTWFGNVRNSPPHKAPTTKKNGAPINPKRRTEPMSQIFISLTFHIKRPGGMREAVRRPTGNGALDTSLDLLGSGPRFSSNFWTLVPPYYSPQRPCTFRRADSKFAGGAPVWPPKSHPKF